MPSLLLRSSDGSGYRFYSLLLYPIAIPCSIDSIVINPGSNPVTLVSSSSSSSVVGEGSWKKLGGGSYRLNATLAVAYATAQFNAGAMVEEWLSVPVPYVTVMCTERSPWNYVMAAGKLTKLLRCPTKADVPLFPVP